MKLLNPDPAVGNGNGGDWTATLPDDIKPVVTAKGWKNPADVITSYRNLEQTLGTKRFELPSPNWDEKKWGEFYTAAGRPESPDKYLDSDVKLPEGVSVDAETMKAAKAHLHKLGLSTAQAKGVIDFHLGNVASTATAAVTARTKAMDEANAKLKTEWGQDYDKNLGYVKKAYEKFATPEFEKRLVESGLGNDPDLIRMFSKIGLAMNEDSASGRGAGQLDPKDAASALEEINRLKKDAKFNEIYFNTSHAEHKAAVANWEALHKRAFGTQPVGQA